MKLRTIVFIFDLNGRETKAGKSCYRQVMDVAIPSVTALEPGDCVMLYGEQIGVYDEIGCAISALNQFKPYEFHLPSALNQMMQIVNSIDLEEDVWFFVVTNQYQADQRESLARVLGRSSNMNSHKTSRLFFYSISPAAKFDFSEATCRAFADAGDVSVGDLSWSVKSDA